MSPFPPRCSDRAWLPVPTCTHACARLPGFAGIIPSARIAPFISFLPIWILLTFYRLLKSSVISSAGFMFMPLQLKIISVFFKLQASFWHKSKLYSVRDQVPRICLALALFISDFTTASRCPKYHAQDYHIAITYWITYCYHIAITYRIIVESITHKILVVT